MSGNVLIQHRDGNSKPATTTQVGPESRSYLCQTVTGKVFSRNRKHNCQIRLPDTQPEPVTQKSCMKQKTTGLRQKRVTGADYVHITTDVETAYLAATQGIQSPCTEQPPMTTPPSVAPIAVSPLHAAPPAPEEAELAETSTDEGNQSHLSDSKQKGNAEESLLMGKSLV